jgi:hypothetical protein
MEKSHLELIERFSVVENGPSQRYLILKSMVTTDYCKINGDKIKNFSNFNLMWTLLILACLKILSLENWLLIPDDCFSNPFKTFFQSQIFVWYIYNPGYNEIPVFITYKFCKSTAVCYNWHFKQTFVILKICCFFHR